MKQKCFIQVISKQQMWDFYHNYNYMNNNEKSLSTKARDG